MRSSWFIRSLVLAVLAGLGVLLWAVRGRDGGAGKSAASGPGGPSGSDVRGGQSPRELPDDDPPPPELDGGSRTQPLHGQRLPPPPDAAPAGVLPAPSPDVVADLDEAHGHLVDAARPCAAGLTLPKDNAFVRFTYRLTIAGGEATVSDVTLVDLGAGAEPLEVCVLDKVAKASWRAGGEDRTTTVDDHVTVKELR